MSDHSKHEHWKRSLYQHADQLEREANVARVVALADSPLDGIAVAWDLLMAAGHRARARIARDHGEHVPAAPPPVSRLLTGFAEAVREKLLATGSQLHDSERQRLAALAPQVLACIEANDKPVVETIVQLLSLSPGWAALWLRAHLDDIEARFAP